MIYSSEVQRMCPVSYTHLDVYKRQVMANQSGDQNGRGGHAISQRIRRCRQQRRCGEFFAEGAVRSEEHTSELQSQR